MSVTSDTRKPTDSLKATWRRDQRQWTINHYIVSVLAPSPQSLGPVPVFKKTDKVPVLRSWTQDVWVIVHAAWPLALQYAYTWLTGDFLSSYAAYGLYSLAFQLNAINQLYILARLGQRYGYLDGDEHARDDVPDIGVTKALHALMLTVFIRPLFTIYLTYDKTQTPMPSIWLPAELFFYSIVLDFFFYIYHRACHEVDFLWRYHRTHHLTKHPNALLSGYADGEQEFIEIALLPILTWAVLKYGLGFPMGFYDWWFCHEFILYAESMGHSGLRLLSGSPGTSKLLLRWLDAELLIEDHDLHHRKGYRKSFHYGKQTRLWDKIFGTCEERLETNTANLDFDNKVSFPLF